MEKISVIVPIYNCEEYILNCLQSIKVQKCNYEVIIVNDGSTDSTEDIVKKFIKENRLGNFKYFYKENSGAADTRNYGLSLSSGEWIMFVDADDCLEEKCFERIVNKLNGNTYDWLICNFSRMYNNKKEKNSLFETQMNEVKEHLLINILNLSYADKKIDSMRNIWGKVYNKKILEKNNIKFHSEIRFFEDGIFNIEYLKQINDIGFINESCYNYNYNPNSVTHTYYANRLEEDNKKIGVLEKILISESDKVNVAKKLFYYEMFCSSITQNLFSKKNRERLDIKINTLKKIIKDNIYIGLYDYNNFRYSKISKKIFYICIKCKLYYVIAVLAIVSGKRKNNKR